VSPETRPREKELQREPRNARADAQAAKAYAKAMRPWYKKKRWWAAGLLLMIINIGAVGGGAGSDNAEPTASKNTSQDAQSEKPTAQEKPAAKQKPEMTSGQKNALKSAQSYLDMSGFSKAGLIQQLSSSAGDGFSKADATFAANHVGADWNKEAVESAQRYLDLQSFSKAALIQLLSSSAGDQYTPAQAGYAVSKVY
jgi:hypothetical protein